MAGERARQERPDRTVASVVIPAFNEQERISKTLDALLEYSATTGVALEIVVVDDGSRDDTARVVNAFSAAVRLCSLEVNRGKGAALKKGVEVARGDPIFFVDADLPYSLDFLDRARPLLEAGQVDAVVGARDLAGSDRDSSYPLIRVQMGWIFSVLVNALLPIKLFDTQCGIKGFRAQILKEAARQCREDNYTFDIELLLMFRFDGRRIQKLPVRLAAQHGSRVRLVRDSLAMLSSLLQIAFRYHTGRYMRTNRAREVL